MKSESNFRDQNSSYAKKQDKNIKKERKDTHGCTQPDRLSKVQWTTIQTIKKIRLAIYWKLKKLWYIVHDSIHSALENGTGKAAYTHINNINNALPVIIIFPQIGILLLKRLHTCRQKFISYRNHSHRRKPVPIKKQKKQKIILHWENHNWTM